MPSPDHFSIDKTVYIHIGDGVYKGIGCGWFRYKTSSGISGGFRSRAGALICKKRYERMVELGYAE